MTTIEHDEATEPELVPVVVALNRVQRDIGAIGKNRLMTQGEGFRFRGIEDVENALHPVLVRHGVVIVPQAAEHKVVHHESTRANGTSRITTHVFQRIGYRVYGPMGDYIESEGVWGEGSDFSDKATNKSSSSARKYFLMQLLSIPTEDIADSDREHEPIEGGHERARQQRSQQQTADRYEERRESLREAIAGLPDEQRAAMSHWLTEHRISLRRKCSKRDLDAVEQQLALVSPKG